MDHFGDLLLYGSFAVLKGEGAKEVEREVRNIFDSQNPKCRIIIRRGCRRAPVLRVSYPSPNERITAPETTPDISPVSRIFEDSLESVPGEIAKETNEELLTQRSLGTPDIHVRVDISPRALVQSDAGSKVVCMERSSSSLLPQTSVTSPGPGSPESPSTPTRRSRVKDSESLTRFGTQFKNKGSRHRDFPRAVRNAKCAHDPYNFLYLFNGPFISPTPLLFTASLPPRIGVLSPSEISFAERADQNWRPARAKPTKLEKELANELGFDFPKRVQYKVYLFERILLCCKEINPNKPKNKMLGTNKPLTDKKGKLRLQLKGRIFMQNVTDVVSLVKSGRCCYWP